MKIHFELNKENEVIFFNYRDFDQQRNNKNINFIFVVKTKSFEKILKKEKIYLHELNQLNKLEMKTWILEKWNENKIERKI